MVSNPKKVDITGPPGEKMHRDILRALVVYILLFTISFILSINLGLGEAESIHDPSSALLYARRVIMIIAAVVFLRLTRKENRQALGLQVSVRWIGISLLTGLGHDGVPMVRTIH
jgi:hypothetical protein